MTKRKAPDELKPRPTTLPLDREWMNDALTHYEVVDFFLRRGLKAQEIAREIHRTVDWVSERIAELPYWRPVIVREKAAYEKRARAINDRRTKGMPRTLRLA